MGAPNYIAKKVGDRYVVVPGNLSATIDGALWLGGGALLATIGLLRRGAAGVLLGAAGSAMIYRGATGRNPLARVMKAAGRGGGRWGMSPSFQNDGIPATQTPEDAVDEASMESFPASDPPARSATP